MFTFLLRSLFAGLLGLKLHIRSWIVMNAAAVDLFIAKVGGYLRFNQNYDETVLPQAHDWNNLQHTLFQIVCLISDNQF